MKLIDQTRDGDDTHWDYLRLLNIQSDWLCNWTHRENSHSNEPSSLGCKARATHDLRKLLLERSHLKCTLGEHTEVKAIDWWLSLLGGWRGLIRIELVVFQEANLWMALKFADWWSHTHTECPVASLSTPGRWARTSCRGVGRKNRSDSGRGS